MADKTKQKLAEQESVGVDRIADISNKIREAISNALPAPPEQFFHVMVPGKVVNFSDYTGGFENGVQTSPVLPLVTELNQAMLCDDMPALSNVQLGPTGRSVSRSYGATLSKLVPKGTTVGVEIADPNKLTDAERRFNKAMDWLLAEDIRNPGKSHLDTYIQKQNLYTAAEEKKNKTFDEAYKNAVNDPANTTLLMKRAAYDSWVNENARKLRNEVEAAYKDLVVHGRKEAVEYWFAVVDNDSAMARVEQSKECMRNSTVMDTDGAVVYPTVKLTPSNWAWLAQQKALAGAAKDQTKTVEQYTWDISNLQKRNRMLKAISENPPQLQGSGEGGAIQIPDKSQADGPVEEAMKDFIAKRTELDNVNRKKGATDDEKKKASSDLEEARGKLTSALSDYDKANIERLSATGLKAMDDLFKSSKSSIDNEIAENEAKIADLDAKRQKLMTNNLGSVSNIMAKEVGLPDPPPPDTPAATPTPAPAPGSAPVAITPGAATSEEDYFIPITVEVSSSYEHQEASQKTDSYSASVHARVMGVSINATASHSKTAADASSQMAKSSVKVSFECMRVDIDRPWLRPELFYDDDLQAAPGAFISPGPLKLKELMDPGSSKDAKLISEQERQTQLQKYSTFPLYPTAFLLACNTVLEISGETAAIQSHFDTSNTTASASVGYGPFSASGSYGHSEQHSSSTCETTASGCRITIKSPQIIGWISEIVPALPRLNDLQAAAAAGPKPAPVSVPDPAAPPAAAAAVKPEPTAPAPEAPPATEPEPSAPAPEAPSAAEPAQEPQV